MKKYKYKDKDGKIFERVNKKTAESVYTLGLPVVLCPVNLRPGEPYHPEIVLNRKNRERFVADEIGVKNDFANQVSSFEYYNCVNSETGKYAAFYTLTLETVASMYTH